MVCLTESSVEQSTPLTPGIPSSIVFSPKRRQAGHEERTPTTTATTQIILDFLTDIWRPSLQIL